MKRVSIWASILLMAVMWTLFGYSLARDHYKAPLEKAQGELALTKIELQQAKSELATFQAILKQLVNGENPEGMRSPQ